MKEIKRYAKYACGKNGVTKDGHTMFIKDMVKDLNRKSYLEEQYTDHKAVVEKGNIIIGDYLKTIQEDNEKFKRLYKRIEELEAETLDYRYKLGLRGGVETKFDN